MFYVRGLKTVTCVSAAGARNSQGVRGHVSRTILKSGVSEMPFPTFWRKNLQNSEGYETPYKDTQIKQLTLFGVGLNYFPRLATHVYGRMPHHTQLFLNLDALTKFWDILTPFALHSSEFNFRVQILKYQARVEREVQFLESRETQKSHNLRITIIETF